MRSRAKTLTLSAAVLVALAATAYWLFRTEQQFIQRRDGVHTFDQRAQEVTDTVGRTRAAQQAYVAEGQGATFWISEVATLIESAASGTSSLQESARTAEAVEALEAAQQAIRQFVEVDRRARDYLTTGQMLMAADVVFTEGAEWAAVASRQIRAAALHEQQAFHAFETRQRRLQLGVLGGMTALLFLVVFALVWKRMPDAQNSAADDEAIAASPLGLATPSPAAPARTPPPAIRSLRAAAEICTDLGQADTTEQLTAALAKAAGALHATGLIVWIGDAAGADLRPVFTHGYDAQTLERMAAIPSAADNAVAAAYRTGAFQVVRAGDQGTGALVAPLLAPAGCIGALTAEVRRGEETDGSLQAVASLVAAQLTGVLAPPRAADEPAASTRTATA